MTKVNRTIVEYFFIALAGLIYAVALKYFVLPSKIILTGGEGLAAALSYYFSNYWLFIVLYVAFQSLLLIFAFFKVSRTFAVRSFCTILTVITCLAFLPSFNVAQPEAHNERIILVIFGGLLAGAAKALAFRSRGSTGDEDILGAYFAIKYLKPVGSVAIVAAIISTVFGLFMNYMKHGQLEQVVNTLMYSCIYIFVFSETLNNLYTKFKVTMLTIITQKPEEVGLAVSSTFEHRTFTRQSGVGGRTGQEFSMIQTIITKEELPKMIDAVMKVDDKCFHYHQNLEGISTEYYITPIA